MKKQNEKHLSVRIDADLLIKFRYVCESHARSANGQLLHYIRQTVREYEEEHHEISTEDLRPKN